jgi:hypothetical protein
MSVSSAAAEVRIGPCQGIAWGLLPGSGPDPVGALATPGHRLGQALCASPAHGAAPSTAPQVALHMCLQDETQQPGMEFRPAVVGVSPLWNRGGFPGFTDMPHC